MNWEAISTIAEIVGALSVIVTLIYISIQTRLSRIAVEETSEHAVMQGFNAQQNMYSEWRRTVLSSPEITNVLVKTRTDENLTDKEQVLFSTYFQELFYTAVTFYRSVLRHTTGYENEGDVTHLLSIMEPNLRSIGEWRNVEHVVPDFGP
ncbi:MAG: hypothetical protein ACI9BW_002388 [Gammaproteobacteria bacterium]|jgi:hypothetical protein